MAKLLAPYNNMMRLGQGFNSFTQEICIDDAVVIDRAQKENIVNNAGMTMKMLAASTVQGIPENASQGEEKVLPQSNLHSTEQQTKTMMGDKEKKSNSETVSTEQKDMKDKLESFTANPGGATSSKDLGTGIDSVHNRIDTIQDQGTQNVRSKTEMPWSSEEALGPAQIVSYQSKFVNNVSEIMDDMGISGSLTIKYNAIGGTGSGAFYDVEKFYDSDLKYYISVKVTNQSINFKDPLAFNPLRSAMRDPDRFKAVFGDSYISGFLEGGEFNALILMNVHNRRKKRDIEAEAKVALTAGPVEISAQGNLKLAEENIKNNTEMTIYVRWCGGGNIKPYNDDWTVNTVLTAAARFPSLVGLFPQRTYAILTKYDTLRSYLTLKPPAMTPLRYEVAALYTNMLVDSYSEYKSLSKRIAADMNDIQSDIKSIKPRTEEISNIKLPESIKRAHLLPYKTTLEGLDLARRDIQKQMNIIMAEIELLAKNPEIAIDEKRIEPFVTSATFGVLLPVVEINEVRKRTTASPMDLKQINPTVTPETAPISTNSSDDDESDPPLFDVRSSSKSLLYEEQKILDDLRWQSYGIGKDYQVNLPRGSEEKGSPFCTLNFSQTDAIITDIYVIIEEDSKKLSTLCFIFNNGLICILGKTVTQDQLDTSPYKLLDINSKPNYNVRSILLQIVEEQVVGIKVSAGPSEEKERHLIALCSGVPLENNFEFVPPSGFSRLSGMWGRADEEAIYRLGFIWGRFDSTNGAAITSTGANSDLIPCLTGMVYLNKDSVGKLKRDCRYYQSSDILPDDPGHLIFAPCLVKADEKSTGALRMGAEVSNITNEGFTLTPIPPIEQDTVMYDWMVLPDLENFKTDTGIHAINCQEPKSFKRLEKSITFAEIFGREIPTVVCWFTSINIKPKEQFGPIYAKVFVTNVTSTSFIIVFESDESSTIFENLSVGWLAFTTLETKDNAQFITTQNKIKDFNKESKLEVSLNPSLCQTPNHTFLAYNEIKLVSTKEAPDFSISIREKTKTKISLLAGSLASIYKSVETLGTVCIVSV